MNHELYEKGDVLMRGILLIMVASATVTVARAEPVSFQHEVIPLLTKLGCNGGNCHGKTGGQKGFGLSLFGFEPDHDYDSLVKESHGRRLFPAAPEQSLLLRKAAGLVPHAGGKRLEIGSDEYRRLLEWIRQGSPRNLNSEPTVVRIEIEPKKVVLALKQERRLRLTAILSDGAKLDITRLARYDSNDPEYAEVSPDGAVRSTGKSGSVGIMARYQTFAVAAEILVPLGKPVASLPPPRNFIDEIVFARWKQLGLPPSPRADDLTLLRRVTIDLAGRLPTLQECETFLGSKDADRLDRAIDRLLDSDDYAYQFAKTWNSLLRNRRKSEKEDPRPSAAFHQWIVNAFRTNMPFDQFARAILTAEGPSDENPAVLWYRDVATMSEQAEDAAQLFLGQRITCAKCHHHPLEKWDQDDYYRFAAFFSRVEIKLPVAPKVEKKKDAKPMPAPLPVWEVKLRGGSAVAQHPKTKAMLPPRGLDGPDVKGASDQDPRAHLVDWLTLPDNPFFARALANRTWKHFFGKGIVDPEDDLRATNPASNAELLDGLAAHFVKNRFNVKSLVKVIVSSHAYQVSSEPGDFNRHDRQNFSRFVARRLSAETLLDALDDLTGSKTAFKGMPPGVRAIQLPDNQVGSYFLSTFGRPDNSSACECERSSDSSLAQALHLLNSKELLDKISQGRAAKLAADNRPHAIRFRELYLIAFARLPSPSETAALQAHLDRHSDVRAVYEDIVWSIANSKEFFFNH